MFLSFLTLLYSYKFFFRKLVKWWVAGNGVADNRWIKRVTNNVGINGITKIFSIVFSQKEVQKNTNRSFLCRKLMTVADK